MNKIVEFFVPGSRIATAGSKTASVLWNCRSCKSKLGAHKGPICPKCGSSDIYHFTSYRPASIYTKPWMDTVKFFAMKAYPRGIIHHGPIGLIIWFHMPRPKGHYGTGRNEGVLKEWAEETHATKQPDLAKCVRAIEDSLTKIVWKDDSQVVCLQTAKMYKEPTGAHVIVMHAPDIAELKGEPTNERSD